MAGRLASPLVGKTVSNFVLNSVSQEAASAASQAGRWRAADIATALEGPADVPADY